MLFKKLVTFELLFPVSMNDLTCTNCGKKLAEVKIQQGKVSIKCGKCGTVNTVETNKSPENHRVSVTTTK